MAFDPRSGGFFMLTGVTIAGFASGFGVCLFDVNTIDACVEVARQWQDVFMDMGAKIITWGIALVHAILAQR